jgi:hypothetical protein
LTGCAGECSTERPPEDPRAPLKAALDPITEKCGDFYMLYGDEAGISLPIACMNQTVKDKFKKYREENPGLLRKTRDAWKLRTRDAWKINCANPYYSTLCHQ